MCALFVCEFGAFDLGVSLTDSADSLEIRDGQVNRRLFKKQSTVAIWIGNIAEKGVIVSITVDSLFVSHVGMKTSTRAPPASGLRTTE